MPAGEQVAWGHWSTPTTDVIRNSLPARRLGFSACYPISRGQVAGEVVVAVMGAEDMMLRLKGSKGFLGSYVLCCPCYTLSRC